MAAYISCCFDRIDVAGKHNPRCAHAITEPKLINHPFWLRKNQDMIINIKKIYLLIKCDGYNIVQ